MRNTAIELSPLEKDLLNRYYVRYKDFGFPPVGQLSVKRRENTGVGRYTYLSHKSPVPIGDVKLDLGNYSQFDMDGLEAGASFWVNIEESKIVSLEILLNGEFTWDGVERPWVVFDPMTGERPQK